MGVTKPAHPFRFGASSLPSAGDDFRLPGGDGDELAALGHALHPGAAIVIISGAVRPTDHARLAKVERNVGATFLEKPFTRERLETAVRVSPRQKRVALAVEVLGRRGGLSPAQRDVVERAGLGQDNDEIATARGCAPETVQSQLCAIYRKLGVKDRSALVARVLHAAFDLDQVDHSGIHERDARETIDFMNS